MADLVSMYEKYFKDPKREPVLVDYVRTPIGRRNGTIGRHRGDDLVVHCYHNNNVLISLTQVWNNYRNILIIT